MLLIPEINVIKEIILQRNIAFFCIIFSTFLFSCTPKPEIENFDSAAWKKDDKGCNGIRNSLAPILESERKKLKGVQEADLVQFLGQPNSIQIMERKQKYLSYWIFNPAACDSSGEYREVKIRISALNLVTEVLF